MLRFFVPRSSRLPAGSARRVAGGVPLLGAIVGAFGMGLAAMPAAHAQITINNPGTDEAYYWGNPDVATFGQVITAPTGSLTLSDYTFTISRQNSQTGSGPGPVAYKAYVYVWNEAASRITGSALYSSAEMVTPNNVVGPITINTGATPVTVGTQYAIFFSTSGVQTSPNGRTGQFAFYGNNADTYAGGHYIANASGNDFSKLSTTSWVTNGPSDLRFTANFTSAASAPEPGSLALLALGITSGGLPVVGTIAARRRRKAAFVGDKHA